MTTITNQKQQTKCVTVNIKIGLFTSTSSLQPVDSREATNVTTNYKQAGPPAKSALLTLASQRLSNIISLPCFCTSFIWLHLKCIKISNPRFPIPFVRQLIEICHENHCYHCHFRLMRLFSESPCRSPVARFLNKGLSFGK